jgi:hypothetical protein
VERAEALFAHQNGAATSALEISGNTEVGKVLTRWTELVEAMPASSRWSPAAHGDEADASTPAKAPRKPPHENWRKSPGCVRQARSCTSPTSLHLPEQRWDHSTPVFLAAEPEGELRECVARGMFPTYRAAGDETRGRGRGQGCAGRRREAPERKPPCCHRVTSRFDHSSHPATTGL